MSLSVLLALLVGALLHACWNVSVKSEPDKLRATAGVFIGSGLLAACALPFVPVPAAASWPYLVASVVTELIYGALLATVYRVGDLSHAYPLMRGSAPLLVAVGGVIVIGEQLSRAAWLGIALVCGGILSLILTAGNRGQSTRATRLALLNAVVIASYTLIDGIGVRKSGQSLAYTIWLFVITGVAWLFWLAARTHADQWRKLPSELPRWMLGGMCSVGSYGIALWAMTLAPIATVAAVRESSIIFSIALAALVLHERVTVLRAMAAGIVALGVCAIRVG